MTHTYALLTSQSGVLSLSSAFNIRYVSFKLQCEGDVSDVTHAHMCKHHISRDLGGTLSIGFDLSQNLVDH